MKFHSYHVLVLVLTTSSSWAATPFAPLDAPAVAKALAVDVIRDKLIRELATLNELKAEARHSDRKEFLGIVQITTFEGWATLRFTNPAQGLKVAVPVLQQVGPNEIAVTIKAEGPASGHAHAGIEKGPSIGSDFSATVYLEISGPITWKIVNDKNVYNATVKTFAPSLANLAFSNDIANQFARVAEKAANDWAAANRQQLLDKVNAAIQKSVADSRLEGTFDGFIMAPSP
jgi:hypothetical protein